MFKRKMKKPADKQVNFLLLDGGVGDHMASLAALDYSVKRYPWIKPLVWVPDYLETFTRHALPPAAKVGSYTSMTKSYNPNLTTKTTKWDGVISPMKTHLLDYAFLKLLDENPSIEHKNYLKLDLKDIDISDFKLPRKYVVITSGYTAKVRQFYAKHINEVARYLLRKGFTPIFLGQTKTYTGAKHIIEGNFDDGIDFSQGINLVNETTLLQAAKIMSLASAVVGVDNGLLHVAGCTDVPIVGGFTSVTPEIRMPVRNNILGWNFYPVVPDKPVGCVSCQETTNFLYGHDYRSCVFRDNKCAESLTARKFIEQLERIL